jgi:hypothetical protein
VQRGGRPGPRGGRALTQVCYYYDTYNDEAH